MTSEKNRIQKVLVTSNIKLGMVISYIFGVSGRKLLERIMTEGYINQEEVEQNIHGKMAHKKQLIIPYSEQSMTISFFLLNNLGCTSSILKN